MLRLAGALALLLLATGLEAQTTADIVVRTAGPGRAGRLVRDAAARPHVTIRTAERNKAIVAKEAPVTSGVIAVGVHVAVEGRVEGDVVVVNGDLFMHPGGYITGNAIAVGGGVYGSSLATIEGESFSFPEIGYDVQERDGRLYLDYRPFTDEESGFVSLPLLYGIRAPSYARVDGLSIPAGPRVTLLRERLVIDPLVTYRSDIGAWDPSLWVDLAIRRRDRLTVWAGRGTFTNDTWIQSDLLNSISTFVAGRDRRNYFRAERAEARLTRQWQFTASDYEVTLGGRGEFAYSVLAGGPWSIWGRDDEDDGMRRPNPAVQRGRLYSALAAVRGRWEPIPEVTGRLGAEVEHALRAPGDADFTQVTIDGAIHFPTFGFQSFELETHAVATVGDDAPPQRFSYLGGSGTLPTFDLLEFGGDQLLYFDARYNIPITRIQLPLVGPPVLSLRYMIGSAGVGSLPSFEQNLGLRLAIRLVKVDFAVEPNSGDTKVSVGLTMMR